MLSVPCPVELSDLTLSATGVTGPEFARMVAGQYERLRGDAIRGGRVMALALPPLVTGQAFRAKYFDQALESLSRQPGIWLTTSDEIAGHYRRTTGSARRDPLSPRPG